MTGTPGPNRYLERPLPSLRWVVDLPDLYASTLRAAFHALFLASQLETRLLMLFMMAMAVSFRLVDFTLYGPMGHLRY